ncbi:SRPBCC family protein [Dactylosporangium sp. AC04546]|uniref:SRPBCC family protein n=1 Tax=Dactylosporangium sp. AC04546 TaxID=2862460 RepID=UPI001EDD0232|nr:SRPBCC family protein [Dactylosporangium sp. AC04546]WVK85698.1 SRPBCC family protein [Dactylosporangium sp. AC04546]
MPVPVDQAWAVLLDIERIAPCMPGATLTGHDDAEGTFTGTVKVKLGPVSLTFKGSGRFVERDEAAHRVQLTASGADARGGGTAAARVTASLHEEADGTRVEVRTDLDITGKAAQFGRGLIGDVSGKLIGQFADCLAGKLAAGSEPAPEVPAAAVAGAAAAEASGAGPVTEPAAPAAPAAPAVPAKVAEPEPEDVEPIDLLAVSGVGSAVRRAVPYVLTAAASFAVVLGIIWWIKRR